MKRCLLVVGVLVLLVVLPACLPSFPSAGALEVSLAGSGGTVIWSRATDSDSGQSIDLYRVDVDGVEIARIPGSDDSCVLSGLTSGAHQVAVTAYDSAGDWSGGASSGARLVATVTALAPAPTGSPVICTQVADTSQDSIVVNGIGVDAVVGPDLGVALREVDTSGISGADGVELRVDALGIRVAGLAHGGLGRVSLTTSEATDTVRVLSGGTWSTLPDDGETGAALSGDGFTTTVIGRDGGRGDSDGAVNGAVVMTLGLGSTKEFAGAPNPTVDVAPPEAAPGWSEARPLIVTGGSLSTLSVARINSAGELQYTRALGNNGAFFGFPFDTTSPWTDWTTIEGTGALVGSPARVGANFYARGTDGLLRRLSGTIPTTTSWVASVLPPLPGGVSIVGSPSSGLTRTGSTAVVVLGSDGAIWALPTSGAGATWSTVMDPDPRWKGAITVTSRSDGTGADLWVHREDHSRQRISYRPAMGWSLDGAEAQGGTWAGSPSSLTLPDGRSAVVGVTRDGSLGMETSRGVEESIVVGTGFVGSTDATGFLSGKVIAAVRADGLVTLSLIMGNNPFGRFVYTIGTPGQPGGPKSPASGSLISPGTGVTMRVSAAVGATGYRWKLFEVPLSGVESLVATEMIEGEAGLSWAQPASVFRNGVRYRWQVEAFRADTGLYLRDGSNNYFTVTDGLAPALISPSDGAKVTVDSTGSTVLKVAPVPGATAYRFTLTRGTSSSSWSVTCCGAGETSVSFAIPAGTVVPGRSYSWSVQAVFAGTAGAAGAVHSFAAVMITEPPAAPPAAPSLLSPGEGSLVADVAAPTALSAWSPTSGHEREFRFELWERVPGGRAWVAGYTSPAGYQDLVASWTVPPGTMRANRTYEWTVRVYDYATEQLGSWPQPRTLSTITNTLGTDQVLTPGSELHDSGYRLIMQLDGNVVVYRPDGSVQAATNRLVPVGTPYPYLVMQSDGNLVEYQNQPGADRKVIWASGSRGSNAYLVMQGDGNAVVYRNNPGADRSALWASNSLIPQPATPPPLPQPPSPPPSGLDRWKQVSSPLPDGTTSTNGETKARSAAVFQREFGTATAPNSGQLLTYTLNLAMGKEVNTRQDKDCGGIRNRRRWICFPGRIGSTVVADLRENLVPDTTGADPAVVVTVQEARPVAVDAIASRLSAAFGTKVYTLFVDTKDPSADVRNSTPGACDDGTENAIKYRCEYGNAIISTVPLDPLYAIYFEHPKRPDQDRAFVAASTEINGRTLVVATLHGQCLCDRTPPIDPSWEDQRAADFELLSAALAGTPGQLLIGADWNVDWLNDAQGVGALTGTAFVFEGGNVRTNSSGQIDFFLSRPGLAAVSLGGTGRNRTVWPLLDGYEFDHARVAVRWQP